MLCNFHDLLTAVGMRVMTGDNTSQYETVSHSSVFLAAGYNYEPQNNYIPSHATGHV